MSTRAPGSTASTVAPGSPASQDRAEPDDAPLDGYARPELPRPLRNWQREALAAYLRVPRPDFLLVASPGAGKTACALAIGAGPARLRGRNRTA